MDINNIFVLLFFICFFCWGIFYYKMLSLELKIDNMINGKKISVFSYLQLWRTNYKFFFIKYNFYDEYENKEVLKLSRKHDRLVPVFYLITGGFFVILILSTFIKEIILKGKG